MGDPKTTKKKFDTPRHPWVKEVINSEKELMKQYGLKNKKEVWKFKTKLRDFKSQSKQFSHNEEESEKQEAFLKKLRKVGILNENQGVDEVLGLEVKDILERRLQTVLYRKNMANSMRQARQFIVHNHIVVSGRVIDVPGYLVKKEEEDSIEFSNGSPLASPEHPEVANVTKTVEE